MKNILFLLKRPAMAMLAILVMALVYFPLGSYAQNKQKKKYPSGTDADAAAQSAYQHALRELEEASMALEKTYKQQWPQFEQELAKAQKELMRQEQLLAKDAALIAEELEKQSSKMKAAAKLEFDALEEAMAAYHLSAAASAKELAKARVDLLAANSEIAVVYAGLAALKQDNLIKEGERVEIEWKDNTLWLNGKAQTPEVSAKYKSFFGNSKLKGTLKSTKQFE